MFRTHAQIISDATAEPDLTGHAAVAARLSAVGHALTPEQTRFWELRGSVPPERWLAMQDAGLATVEELGAAAEAKKLPDLAGARLQKSAAA